MTWPGHGPRMRPAGGPTRLLALLVLLAMAAACVDQPDQDATPAASPAPTTPTTAPPSTTPATTTAPSRSTAWHERAPQPIPRGPPERPPLRGVLGGGVAGGAVAGGGPAAGAGHAGLQRRPGLRPGARRWLGVPATITSRVAVYFGTERTPERSLSGCPYDQPARMPPPPCTALTDQRPFTHGDAQREEQTMTPRTHRMAFALFALVAAIALTACQGGSDRRIRSAARHSRHRPTDRWRPPGPHRPAGQPSAPAPTTATRAATSGFIRAGTPRPAPSTCGSTGRSC